MIRNLTVSWPGFHDDLGIEAEISLAQPDEHESINIVIPIGSKRFYYNRKINCLPASGCIQYGEEKEILSPESVWVPWTGDVVSGNIPASGNGRVLRDSWRMAGRLELNMGGGFGDTSQASENAFFINGILHKLDTVTIDYSPENYTAPWHFSDNHDRLSLEFVPFKERVAETRLGSLTVKSTRYLDIIRAMWSVIMVKGLRSKIS